MGMFDTIVYHDDLPKIGDLPRDFQTKCLDCNLDTYYIDDKGRCWKGVQSDRWGDGIRDHKELVFPDDYQRYPLNAKFWFYTFADRVRHEWKCEVSNGIVQTIEKVAP